MDRFSDTVESVPSIPRGLLLVDDEITLLDLWAEYLQEKGFRVWRAVNGEHAMALLSVQSHEIGAVVLDLHMPKLGGAKTVQLIGEQFCIPCLIVSGWITPGEEQELVRQGAVRVLHKNRLSLEELHQEIRVLL